MKIGTLLIFILSSALFFGGCATQINHIVRVEEPWRRPFVPDSYGVLPARSPEQCHNSLIEGFQQDSDRGFIQTVRFANTMIGNWPHHRYIVGSVFLAGWSVLFADTGHRAAHVGKDTLTWESYVDSLLTASYYFEMSARRDASTDGFWTSVSGVPLGMIHEGFKSTEAFRLYLVAQRLVKITYLRTQDEKTLIDAVKIMEIIEEKYPEWARQYGVGVDKQETINAIAVHKTRREESKRIFGR